LSEQTYASLGRRFAAHLVDILIAFSVLLLTGIVMRILRAIGFWTPTVQDPEQTWRTLGVVAKLFIIFAFILSMGPIYFILFESSTWQATFGKRMLRIYVTDDGRKRITTMRSLGRWLSRWFCGWFGGNFLSLITIAVTGNRKAIHDFLAGTLILRGQPPDKTPLEPWRIAAAFGLPFVWLLGTFMVTM